MFAGLDVLAEPSYAVLDMEQERKTPRPPDGFLNVRVPKTKLDKLAKLAEVEYRTVSQEIRRMIDVRLAEAEKAERAEKPLHYVAGEDAA
jgi:hypothetical protein